MTERMWKLAEAAERCGGRSYWWAYKRVKATREFPEVRLDGQLVIPDSALQKWIDEHTEVAS